MEIRNVKKYYAWTDRKIRIKS